MDEAVQAHLAALAKEARAAAIASDCKHTVVWCIGQLPTLYAKFRQTSESRYGEEISRLVRGVLEELAKGTTVCPVAQKLAASITGHLRMLHEEVGLPGLGLTSPRAPTARPRKVG
ncbi:MAG TPA: hypothetical protein VG013_35380 [Gemmataceae bacterium]|jgi:hypothetical protein|nr:hypothetical protein [Gemmataceae bacterium]